MARHPPKNLVLSVKFLKGRLGFNNGISSSDRLSSVSSRFV